MAYQFTGKSKTTFTVPVEGTDSVQGLRIERVPQSADGSAVATVSSLSMTGAVTNAYGIYLNAPDAALTSGTLTNVYSQYIAAPTKTGAGSVTNATGLYIDAPSISGATNYSLVTAGSAKIATSLVTDSTTFALVNTNATTINFGGAATTLSIGAASGTTTVNNDLVVTQNVNIGASKAYQINSIDIVKNTGVAGQYNISGLIVTRSSATITTGVWQGSIVGILYGGTGSDNGSITGSSDLVFTSSATNASITLTPKGTGTVSVSNFKITSLATPTASTDAANKQYVDDKVLAAQQGLDVKESVRVATTGSLGALSGLLQIDGIQTIAGDRVLVKNQGASGLQSNAAVANGVYIAASGAWSRAIDFDDNPDTEVTPGAFFFVEEGDTYRNAGFVIESPSAGTSITVGTTAIKFNQFSGAGQLTEGYAIDISPTGAIAFDPTELNNGDINISKLSANTISGVALGGSLFTLSLGTHLSYDSGTTYNGSADKTLSIDATSANTASTVVSRDASGDFSTRNITLSKIVTSSGNFVFGGAATSATLAIADTKTLTVNNSLTLNGTGNPTIDFGSNSGTWTAAYKENNLSVFASTTSAQLAGVLNDETGYETGAVSVFSKNPTFSTSATATSSAITLSGGAYFNAISAPSAPTSTNAFLYNKSGEFWQRNANGDYQVLATADVKQVVGFTLGSNSTKFDDKTSTGFYDNVGNYRKYGMYMLFANGVLNTTTTELTADGGAVVNSGTGINIIRLPARTGNVGSAAWMTKIFVSGLSADGLAVGWEASALFKKSGATTSIVGDPVVIASADTGLQACILDIDVDDTTNDALRIRVTGVSGKTINWNAVIQTTEVG